MRFAVRLTLGWSAILLVSVLRAGGLVAAEAEARPPLADVVSVAIRGESGALRFSVGIESPDTGCEQYAD